MTDAEDRFQPPPPSVSEERQPPPPSADAVRREPPRTVQPDPPAAPRRYDLDALRGFAMLLGIALHAAIPFVPYWDEDDSGGWFLTGVFEFVHGFRMPLFFLLSGFFTTMLWRRRGLGPLIKHRLRRIALPLLIGLFTILPAVVIGIIAGYVISGESIDEGDAVVQYDEEIVSESPGEPDTPKLVLLSPYLLSAQWTRACSDPISPTASSPVAPSSRTTAVSSPSEPWPTTE